jgi:iron complex outermembrane recepter protein
LTQGLNCDVVNDRAACFNPFVSTDPSTLNTQAVADSTYLQNRVYNVDKLQTASIIVLNGTLGGPELARWSKSAWRWVTSVVKTDSSDTPSFA